MADRKRVVLLVLVAVAGWAAVLWAQRRDPGRLPAGGEAAEVRGPTGAEAGFPPRVADVLRSIDEEGTVPPGFEGGGVFRNEGRRGGQVLPRSHGDGKPVEYRAWDVNRREPGKGRGAERLVTGSDGSAYYTADDFQTFVTVRKPHAPHAPPEPRAARPDLPEGERLPADVAARVDRILSHVQHHDYPLPGYVGGRTFGNNEHRLPRLDDSRRSIQYREWDVNPRVAGRDRGAERLITGSDGRAYYTEDHYRTFRRVR